MTDAVPRECPPAEMLGAFLEGKLSEPERAEIAKHLESCPECMFVLGEAGRFEREALASPGGSVVPFRGASRWWLVAAAAVVVLAFGALLLRQLPPRDPMERMIALAGEVKTRPVEARLARFPYAAWTVTRSGVSGVEPSSLKLKGAAGEVLESSAHDSSAAGAHARGVAHLLAGDPASAIRELESATSQERRKSEYWSDLAAARYTLGVTVEDPQLLMVAVAAADQALEIDRSNASAAFNRGLALQAVGQWQAAADAYRAFLQIEQNSPWADEARQRLSRLQRSRNRAEEWPEMMKELRAAVARGDTSAVEEIVRRFPQESRTWGEGPHLAEWGAATLAGDVAKAEAELQLARGVGSALQRIHGESLLADAVKGIDASSAEQETMLASGHVAYRRARMAIAKRQVSDSIGGLQESTRLFNAAGSPMRYVAKYYLAVALTDLGAIESARRTLDEAGLAPGSYRALHAHVLWQRGSIDSRQGNVAAALEHYRTALGEFQSLGEVDNAAMMLTAAALMYASLGESNEAWRLRKRLFEMASESGSASLMQQALLSSARSEARRNQWAVARALLNLAGEERIGRANRRLWADTLIWSVLANHYEEMPMARERSLTRARTVSASLEDPQLRSEAEADLRFVEGRVLAATNPATAIEKLASDVEYRRKRGETLRLAEALAERGRCHQQIGSFPAALADLDEAAEVLEASREKIVRADLRDTFLGARRSVYEDLVEVFHLMGRPEQSFEASERGRARRIVPRGAVTRATVSQTVASLPGGTALISLNALPQRMILFWFTSETFETAVIPVGRREFERRVSEMRQAILANSSEGDTRSTLLFSSLFEPISTRLAAIDRLIIVADDFLMAVPFSSLKNPKTSRYLIEDTTIVVAPSATFYVNAGRRDDGQQRRVLIVDGGSTAGSPLQATRDEVERVSREWPDATVLRGAHATSKRVLKELESCSMFHFSGHALLNESDPALSLLQLPSRDSAVFVRDIAEIRNDRLDLVYLAACRTGLPGRTPGEVSSMATAFLAAGGRNVVGSLWDVDDRIAADMAASFYERWRNSLTAADALREVQLRMIHGADPIERQVRSWSAVQVFGA